MNSTWNLRRTASIGRRAIRPLLVLAVAALLIDSAQAKISLISGVAFVGPDPVLQDEGMMATGFAIADDELPGQGGGELHFDLTQYANDSMPVGIMDFSINFSGAGDGIAEFVLGPGTLTKSNAPPGIIGTGKIEAEITGIGPNTTTLVDIDHFVGGSFIFTYNAVNVLSGTTATGGSAEFQFPASASYSLAAVPEPSTLLLAALGLLALLSFTRRRRK
jgi:hypothetical protein